MYRPFNCSDCVHQYKCPCGNSLNNAACLVIRKDRNRGLRVGDKVVLYIRRIKDTNKINLLINSMGKKAFDNFRDNLIYEIISLDSTVDTAAGPEEGVIIRNCETKRYKVETRNKFFNEISNASKNLYDATYKYELFDPEKDN